MFGRREIGGGCHRVPDVLAREATAKGKAGEIAISAQRQGNTAGSEASALAPMLSWHRQFVISGLTELAGRGHADAEFKRRRKLRLTLRLTLKGEKILDG